MLLSIDWINEHPSQQIKQDHMNLVEEALEEAARIENISDVEFAIIIVDNHRIQEINREYRQIDAITDVISFALNDDLDEDDPGLGINDAFLGDIIISYDKAIDQANEYGHSFEREFVFLALHGFLHLIGYDHQTPDQESEMFSIQEQILNQMKLGVD